MPKFVRILLAVLALLACSAHAQNAPSYRAFKFDGQFVPKFVNDLGQVAGIGQNDKPVIWNPDGSMLELPGAVSQLTITGFNNQGTVTGSAVIPGYSLPQPVVWRNGGAVERLPFQGLGGLTEGVNNRGDIIGQMSGASDTGSGQVGFIQWGDGRAPQLFDNFAPQMINDQGLVLGQRSEEWGYRTWQDGAFGQSAFSDLYIRAINNEGRMAGTQSSYHAFSMLERDGQRDMQELWIGFAWDINDAGSVVGETELIPHALLWHQDRSYVLDHLWEDALYSGWSLLSAWDINNNGAILADAVGPLGENARFLLSPVPEPAPAALLLAGLMVLLAPMLARRKRFAGLLSSSLLVLLAGGAHAQNAPAYRALQFDGQFMPKFLNDAGQIAGIGADGKPLIRNPDGSIVHLPGVVSQLSLTGFNNEGTIIGNAAIPGFAQPQPVVWRHGGAMELLPLAGSGGYAAGINNRGDIVGYSTAASGDHGQIGFIQWGDGSAPQLFDDYRPHLINDLGLVVGGRNDEFGVRTWRDGVFGRFQLAYDYRIRDVNSEGRLTGFQDIGKAFTLLEGDGVWQQQELWSSYAYAINDAGSVVGESDYRRAMLWYQDRPYVLDHLWHEPQYAGWYLESAWDINAGGQILARAGSDWETYAVFLLSPVPEPGQGGLLLAGLALLGSLRLRSVRRSA